jgi:hypothetical protein
VLHARGLRPFLAAHLHEARATARKGEKLLFATKHGRRTDDIGGKTLQDGYKRSACWLLRGEKTTRTRSSMMLRMWSETSPLALSSEKIWNIGTSDDTINFVLLS